jgi:5'-3' exonuclease
MKVNLTIDGNYLLHKDVFILFSMKTLYSDLPILLRKDLDTLSKMYAWDKVYFVSDSKMRWRKQFYEPYKDNRKQDDKIDWEWIYNEYNKFKEDISRLPNVIMYEVDWAEGDDLISHITQTGNEKGYSNIIIASDGDLHQLIKFDLDLEYINVMYNYKFSDERTYWPTNYNIFIKEMFDTVGGGLFDMNDDTEFLNFLEDIEFKTKTKEVSPEEVLLCKMVSGDRKDNVPSVYIKNKRGIGKAGGETIYRLYKELDNNNIDFDSDEFIDKLTEVVCYNKKIQETEKETINEIRNNLVRNRKLLRLDEKYLPPELKSEINNKVKIY